MEGTDYVFTTEGADGTGEIISYGDLEKTAFDEPIEMDIVVWERDRVRREKLEKQRIKGLQATFKLQHKTNVEDDWTDFKREIPSYVIGKDIADTGGIIISLISRDNLLISADGRYWSDESQRSLYPDDDVFSLLHDLEFRGRNIEWRLT